MKGFIISSKDEILEIALKSILRWNNIDELVSFALRRTGYGGTGFGITYPKELDEFDKENGFEIAEGMICIDDDENDVFLDENKYINLLIELCKHNNLLDRAKLLETFLINPDITESLTEASSDKCIKEWKRLIPFLEKQNWKIVEDMILSPFNKILSYNINYNGDIDVLYRKSTKFLLEDLKKNTDLTNSYKSLIKIIDDFKDNNEM